MTPTDYMMPADLKDQVNRANEARLLIENPLLVATLDAIEAEIVDQWKACPIRDHEGKEAVWQLMKTAEKFRAILLGHIQTGKLASVQLQRFEEESRLRRVGRALRGI